MDPLAELFPSVGGYVYSYNNPVMFNDLSGLEPEQTGNSDCPTCKEKLDEIVIITKKKAKEIGENVKKLGAEIRNSVVKFANRVVDGAKDSVNNEINFWENTLNKGSQEGFSKKVEAFNDALYHVYPSSAGMQQVTDSSKDKEFLKQFSKDPGYTIGSLLPVVISKGKGGKKVKKTSLFRGGASLKIRKGIDYKVDADGFVNGRGLSFNSDKLDNFVQKYGGAYGLDESSIPKGLKIQHTGGTHYELQPIRKMKEKEFLDLINQVKLKNYNEK